MQSKLKVALIEHTPNPEKVIATAAKLCYAGCSIDELSEKQTDESVERFLNMLTDIGHESPMEHVSFTFAIEGVSRALTHQLVRHRIASYSQQSQRYVKLSQFNYVIPPAIENNEKSKQIFIDLMERDQEAYDEIVKHLIMDLIMDYCSKEYVAYPRCMTKEFLSWFKAKDKVLYGQFEKKAIEDARYVFPNACDSKIIVTMNARSLMNFLKHRCCNRAQWEIRFLAEEMLKLVKPVSPTLFKHSGPSCVHGKCSEGKMTCGKILEVKEKYLNI